MPVRQWTPEQRAKHAEVMREKIHLWKPWRQSTGARTEAGKAISSQNRAKALEAAKKRITDAKRSLAEAEKVHDRLTKQSAAKRLFAEMLKLAEERRRFRW
ncbi:MAG: hypothetical protein HOP20_09995 [Sulfuriferula sp.]|nr:hypothetical protein [Sulfuriferula sp.]